MAEHRVARPPRGAQTTGALLFSALVAALVAALTPSCLEPRHTSSGDVTEQRCATCHGDPDRQGDYLARSAPPRDLLGRTSTRDPGVGAHALHLHGAATHAAVACDECHIVPERVDSPGHADDDRPADVTFGELARHAAHEPAYDGKTRTCRDSYCHGAAEPRWTAPRTSAEACGTCHGLPPAAPHPQSERCFACHSDVVDEQRNIVSPERHVNGKVEYREGECQSCHGSTESPAPPRDVYGHASRKTLGVGAHQVHLTGGSAGRPLECGECHRVPEHLDEATHADGLPAEVTLRGVSQSGKREPAWDHASASCSDSWCHAPSPGKHPASPVWNEPRSLDCASCHGTPPPAPHPQLTNCASCHGDIVAADNRTIIDRSRHVDGQVDVSFDMGCSSCHGSRQTPAPPRDVSGNVEARAPGVGAHAAHVLGTGRSRAVPCETCHEVPDRVLATGHIDTPLPAEVVLGPAAGSQAQYSAGGCQQTSCHGAVMPSGHASGGSNTSPSWTGTGQATCSSCHGLPPPAPHPNPTFPCHSCHQNLNDDDTTFNHPELHVDGQVTFALP